MEIEPKINKARWNPELWKGHVIKEPSKYRELSQSFLLHQAHKGTKCLIDMSVSDAATYEANLSDLSIASPVRKSNIITEHPSW